MVMIKPPNPILVTGSHRSGSTWIGKVLSLAPHTGYIHEPFNIDSNLPVIDTPFDNWYQFISDDNASSHRQALDRVFNYTYPFQQNLNMAKTARGVAHVIKSQLSAFYNKTRGNRPIVKDPLGFFAAEWLSKTYEMNVLVSIRHPAAFCSSLKIKNWNFDFNSFLDQPLLMQKYLCEYQDEICDFASTQKCIVEQAILLWNCIHRTILVYKDIHPEWLYLRHEDMSREPIQSFKSIYNKLSLEFTPRVRAGIIKSSGSHNPKEQHSKNEFKRDSKANVKNWINRLSADEIDVIRLKTSKIACSFYQDNDW
jgi:LPS sulfotransferase NodH